MHLPEHSLDTALRQYGPESKKVRLLEIVMGDGSRPLWT